MGIFTKDINKGAYRGKLTCPHLKDNTFETCRSSAVRLIEQITPFRLRYRCRKCGKTFQYDISGVLTGNPYTPTRKQVVGHSIRI